MKRICGLEPILLRGVRLKLRVGAPAPRISYLDALLCGRSNLGRRSTDYILNTLYVYFQDF
jgi:hypothetical protein